MHARPTLKHQTLAFLFGSFLIYLILFQVRVVILADRPLEDIFVHDGDHGHDESHILMDDLGLKRVRALTLISQLNQFFMLGVYFQL